MWILYGLLFGRSYVSFPFVSLCTSIIICMLQLFCSFSQLIEIHDSFKTKILSKQQHYYCISNL